MHRQWPTRTPTTPTTPLAATVGAALTGSSPAGRKHPAHAPTRSPRRRASGRAVTSTAHPSTGAGRVSRAGVGPDRGGVRPDTSCPPRHQLPRHRTLRRYRGWPVDTDRSRCSRALRSDLPRAPHDIAGSCMLREHAARNTLLEHPHPADRPRGRGSDRPSHPRVPRASRAAHRRAPRRARPPQPRRALPPAFVREVASSPDCGALIQRLRQGHVPDERGGCTAPTPAMPTAGNLIPAHPAPGDPDVESTAPRTHRRP